MDEEGISRNVTLTWEVETIATSYILEVAKDVNFSNIIVSTSTIMNSYFLKNLDFAEEYFWRVKPINICGIGAFSETRVFNTTLVNCKNYYPSSLPRQISDSEGAFPGVTNVTVNVFDQALIEDINVKHTAKPIAPTKRLTKKREVFSIGKPKKRLNPHINKPIKISS